MYIISLKLKIYNVFSPCKTEIFKDEISAFWHKKSASFDALFSLLLPAFFSKFWQHSSYQISQCHNQKIQTGGQTPCICNREIEHICHAMLKSRYNKHNHTHHNSHILSQRMRIVLIVFHCNINQQIAENRQNKNAPH